MKRYNIFISIHGVDYQLSVGSTQVNRKEINKIVKDILKNCDLRDRNLF